MQKQLLGLKFEFVNAENHVGNGRVIPFRYVTGNRKKKVFSKVVLLWFRAVAFASREIKTKSSVSPNYYSNDDRRRGDTRVVMTLMRVFFLTELGVLFRIHQGS